MSILVPLRRFSDRSKTSANFFVPHHELTLETSMPLTEVVQDGITRLMSTKLLGQVIHFNDRRANQGALETFYLNHDCGVFAAACTLDENFDGEPMYGAGERSVEWDWPSEGVVMLEGLNQPPQTDIGDVLMTTELGPDGQPTPKKQHFLIRASLEDGREPLYVSKLGVVGAAVIHVFNESTRYYPSNAVAPITLRIGMGA